MVIKTIDWDAKIYEFSLNSDELSTSTNAVLNITEWVYYFLEEFITGEIP